MRLSSIDSFLWVRNLAMFARKRWLTLRYGLVIDRTAKISLSARFQCGRPRAIRIGLRSQIAFKALLYTTDPLSGLIKPIHIGKNCFIGGCSLIGPGVTVGDGSIIGGGSIVLEDVPPRCIVAGNPAQVIKRNIEVRPYGRPRALTKRR